MARPRACIERPHGRDDREARVHRAGRIVLVCLGIAEVDEDAVAHVARDEAVVGLDGGPAGVLKRGDDLAQIADVDLARW